MPPYLWGIGIWEVHLNRGSLRCLGFHQGVDSQKNSQTPVETLFLCSMYFVIYGLVQTLKLKNAVHSRNSFIGHCMRQAARSTCTSSLSVFEYTWVLISALRNCVVARFSFYCGRDKLHAPLATFLQEKIVEPKSCKRAWNRKVAKEQKSSQKSQIKILEPSASQKSQICVFWL